MIWKALILAAGLGTRLAPYTDTTPKPMFTLAGRPLLHYWLKRLAKAGCGEVFINTHHLHEQIEAYIACNDWPMPVSTFYEPEILGTGGAIKNIGPYWQNSDLMVINGDVVCDFDLAELLKFHQNGLNDVSLLLTDCEQFNTVSLNAAGDITGFKAEAPTPSLTFTGIQVLAPAVLNHIPANQFYSSIEAFKAMIKGGRKVKGLVNNQSWQDLGDIARYREAALKAAARKAFGKAFNANGEITITPLSGDGSDRIWRRLSLNGHNMVAADHGLAAPENMGKTSEAEAFVNIGQHLNAKNLSVPQIYFHDSFAGLVFAEDVGDLSLQLYVQGQPGQAGILTIYKQVIDALIAFSQKGVKDFDLNWPWQSQVYDRTLILQNECGYFTGRFLHEYLDIDLDAFNLKPEFEHLADEIARYAVYGLMHRDFQSRNIFLKNGRPYFLDYQGARLGPIQYDLASLLYDPYVMLDENTRNLLLDYCCQQFTMPDKLVKGFHYCALSRIMQAQGAFVFLSQTKGKPWFIQYMAPALSNLNGLLAKTEFQKEFPELTKAAAWATQKLEQL